MHDFQSDQTIAHFLSDRLDITLLIFPQPSSWHKPALSSLLRPSALQMEERSDLHQLLHSPVKMQKAYERKTDLS